MPTRQSANCLSSWCVVFVLWNDWCATTWHSCQSISWILSKCPRDPNDFLNLRKTSREAVNLFVTLKGIFRERLSLFRIWLKNLDSQCMLVKGFATETGLSRICERNSIGVYNLISLPCAKKLEWYAWCYDWIDRMKPAVDFSLLCVLERVIIMW